MLKLTKTLARLGLVALPLAGLVASASPAAAKPRQGNTPATCEVAGTDANGKPHPPVPEGTRVGLAYCGSDGEWHFGWLVDGRVEEPTTTEPPVKAPRATTGTLAG